MAREDKKESGDRGDLEWSALERESDASLQGLILLDEWVKEFSIPPTIDQLYAAGSHFLNISKRSLQKCLTRAIGKGYVEANRSGTARNRCTITYELTASGRAAVHEARSIGSKRQKIWDDILSLQKIRLRGLPDE